MTKEQQELRKQQQAFEQQKKAVLKYREEEVYHQELIARKFKAYYESMYYQIECEKLEPEFKALQARMEARAEELKKMKEDTTEQPNPNEVIEKLEQLESELQTTE